MKVFSRLAMIGRIEPPAYRRRVLATYLRLECKRKLSFRPSPAGRILGFDWRGFRYSDFFRLFQEIFLLQSYRFRPLGDTPRILDCGSNVGMSVLYFKTLFPGAMIQAFEPDPRAFALLERNVAESGFRDVQLMHLALGDRVGDVPLYQDPASPGSLLTSTLPGRAEAHSQPVTVPMARLSSFITGEVDFLKLDVEGAEHDVIQDLAWAGKLRSIREMVIEYHHHVNPGEDRLGAFLAMLEDQGFGYQIRAPLDPPFTRSAFQDVLIYGYRNDAAPQRAG